MSLEEKFNIQYKIDHDMFTPEENELIKAIKEPIMAQLYDVYRDYFNEPKTIDHHDIVDIGNYIKDILLTYDQNYHKR